jgi:6-phosphogluconolactonase
MFAALAEADLPWDKVWITLVDERWVEPTHADSNERLVRENLLQGRARAANFIGLKVAGATATGSLRDAIVQLDHVPPPLSCVILGMGSDGHTASWFPRASNLADLLDPNNSSPLAACEPVTAPHERITLTLPVVLGASEIILHITGDEKRAVLQRAAREQLPVAAITEQNLKPVSTWWAP